MKVFVTDSAAASSVKAQKADRRAICNAHTWYFANGEHYNGYRSPTFLTIKAKSIGNLRGVANGNTSAYYPTINTSLRRLRVGTASSTTAGFFT